MQYTFWRLVAAISLCNAATVGAFWLVLRDYANRDIQRVRAVSTTDELLSGIGEAVGFIAGRMVGHSRGSGADRLRALRGRRDARCRGPVKARTHRRRTAKLRPKSVQCVVATDRRVTICCRGLSISPTYTPKLTRALFRRSLDIGRLYPC